MALVQELAQAHALAVEPVVQVVDPLLQLLQHQLLGDVLGDQLDQRVGGLLLQGHLGLDDMALVELLPEVGDQLVGRLELGRLGGPLVGHLGEHQLLHILHQHPEGDGLVQGLEGGVEGQDVAGLGPAELVVELGDHRAAAHLVEEVLGVEVAVVAAGLAAAPVDVDGHLVTVAGGTAHLDQLARRGPEAVHLGGHLVVGDLEAGQGHHQALVAGDGHGGTDQHHGLEGHRARLVARGDVDVGLVDGVDLGIGDRPGVEVGQGLPQGLPP